MSRSRARVPLLGAPLLTALFCGCAFLIELEHHDVLESGGAGGDAGLMSGSDAGAMGGSGGNGGVSSTSGTGGTGGTSSSSGGGGPGGPCSSDIDCLDPKGDCMAPVCQGGQCGMVLNAADTSDGNECTEDACDGGVPSHTIAEGSSCSQGGVCDNSGQCVACINDAQCDGGVCVAEVCTLPPCSNGSKDGAETDVDCGGGTCPQCGAGKSCLVDVDCQSGTCSPAVMKCL